MPAQRARGLDHNLTINGTDYPFENFDFTPNAELSEANNNMSISPFSAPTKVDFDVTINIDGSMREIYNDLYVGALWIPQPATLQLRGPQGGYRFGHLLATGGPYDVPEGGIISQEISAHADFGARRGGSYTAPAELGANRF